MPTASKLRPKFNVPLIVADMALRGWNPSELARRSRKAPQTIGRFLAGEIQTPKVAAAIAKALGHPLARYFSHVEAA